MQERLGQKGASYVGEYTPNAKGASVNSGEKTINGFLNQFCSADVEFSFS